jgi:hypothetical protein
MQSEHEMQIIQFEEAIEQIKRALDLIPINQLRLGYRWIPSDFCLDELSKAKDTLRRL